MWPLFAGAHEWTAPRATAVKRTGVITTGTVSARPSALALMRAAPGANVTTTPLWDTCATTESLLAQTTGRPVSGRPLESRSVTAGGGGPGGVGGTNGPSHAHRPMVTTTQRLFIGVPRQDYIPMIRRRVALAIIHGIGAQRRDWAEGFVRRVRLTVETRFPGVDVYPDVIWWAPVTQRYEDTLIRRYRHGLSWQWLRRLVIGYGGDVIAYQAPPRHDVPPPWTYRAVHGRIDRRLRALQDLLGAAAAAPVPLVAVAHSLGSV